MKKILSIFIILVTMLNICYLPAFAEENKVMVKEAVTKEAAAKEMELSKDKAMSKETLEKLIKLVKGKIDIPSSYTQFNSEINNYDGKTICRLRWSSDTSIGYGKNGGSMEITVDEQGTIQFYNNYKHNRDYEYKRRLPKITKSKAIETASKFVYFLAPDIADQICFNEGRVNTTIEYDGSYRINFYRQYKNIPFYENGISMQVNGITGEIMDYSRNWNDKFVFPEPEKAFDVERAKVSYKKSVGLELKYRRTYGEDKDTTYLEYSPATVNANSSIDALTGEKIIEGNRYNMFGDMGARYEMYKRGTSQSGKEISLSQQEMDELKKMQGLISVESAEKLTRSMEEFGIDSQYTLNRYNYYEQGETGGRYLLTLSFTKAPTKEDFGGDIPEEKLKVMIAAGEFGRTANVTFDAKTSQLISFNSYGRNDGNTGKTSFAREDLRNKAEAFLNKHNSEKYKNSVLLDTSNGFDNYIAKYSMPYYNGEYSFIFARKENGINFEDNQISMSFDPSIGKISYYGENWDDIAFVPVKLAIGIEKAYDVLFKENPMELRFSIAQPSGEIKLVYGFSLNKPVCVDGQKGLLMNYYNAQPYRGNGTTSFTDIENSTAKEQIQALANAGVLTTEEKFNPDGKITQKEFIYMIGKVRGSYYSDTGMGIENQKELDGMYRMMINEGVLEEEEKDPDAGVTREYAVKFLLNAFGYKKFAALEGIFNCDYKDKDKIDPKLVGYVCIAKSLKVSAGSNGYFRPESELTKAEAAIMLYNYMRN